MKDARSLFLTEETQETPAWDHGIRTNLANPARGLGYRRRLPGHATFSNKRVLIKSRLQQLENAVRQSDANRNLKLVRLYRKIIRLTSRDTKTKTRATMRVDDRNGSERAKGFLWLHHAWRTSSPGGKTTKPPRAKSKRQRAPRARHEKEITPQTRPARQASAAGPVASPRTS